VLGGRDSPGYRFVGVSILIFERKKTQDLTFCLFSDSFFWTDLKRLTAVTQPSDESAEGATHRWCTLTSPKSPENHVTVFCISNYYFHLQPGFCQ
jgi:hypothetical protein